MRAQDKNNSCWPGVCRQCGHRYATLAASACPLCGGSIVMAATDSAAPLSWLRTSPLRYPATYLLFELVAAADIVRTFLIVWTEGTAVEVNAIARAVIERLDLPGALAYKFGLVVFIIVMCEVISRRRDEVARRLAEWSVAATTIPVVVSLAQLWQMG